MWSSQLLSAVVVSADRPTVFMPRVDVLYPGQAGSATIRREVRAGYQYQKPALTHTRKIHSLLTDISRCNPVDQSERERKTEIFQINHPTVFTNAPGGKEILRDRDREKEKERERERKRERLY